MSRKIVVIDQSVRGHGGHHLEYALRVFEAAIKRGLEPVLAAHRDFKGGASLSFLAFSVFRYTFWENLRRESTLFRIRVEAVKRRRALARWWKSFLHRRYYRFIYSLEGLAFQRSRELGNLNDPLIEIFASELTEKPTQAWRIRMWRMLVWNFSFWQHHLGNFGKAYKRLPRLARLPGKIFAKGYRFALRTLRRLLVFGLKLVVGLIAGPIFLLIAPFTAGRGHRAAFRSDLQRLLRDAKLQAGDIAFVPTLGETELLAIADLCARSSLARSLQWRLMFRRNIYSGRSNSWGRQNDYIEVRRFRLAMYKAAARLKDVDVRMFTDTTLLTEQYNLSKIFPFETAPVPVSSDFAKLQARKPGGTRLVAGYFGDARDEKGFPVLAQMMDHLYARFASRGRLCLLAQSNFNVPGGEPGSVRSRLALSALPPETCELIEGPFESDAYMELFGRTDVVLVPYDQDNYAARSSGVFAEALVAGKPTLVTRGTWMATLLEPYRQAYLAELRRKLPVTTEATNGSQPSRRIHLRRGGPRPTRGELGEIADLKGRTHLMCEVQFDQADRRHHVVISYTFLDDRKQPVGVIQETMWRCEALVRALTPVPERARSVRIALRPLDARTTLLPDVVTIESLRLRDVPSGFAGRIVDPSPFALAEGLRDILENKQAYQRAAAAIRPEWAEYCSSDLLLDTIMDEGVAVSPEAGAREAVLGVMAEMPAPGADRAPMPRGNVLPLRGA